MDLVHYKFPLCRKPTRVWSTTKCLRYRLHKLKNVLYVLHKFERTLKRDPIDENFEDFDDSSGLGGNKPAAKEHFEAVNKS